MAYRQPARTATPPIRIRWARVAGLLVAIAVTGAALSYDLPASSFPRSAIPTVDVPRREHRRALDPDLQDALRQATADASYDGIEIGIESGRRSPEYQERLLREAVAEYGSGFAASLFGVDHTADTTLWLTLGLLVIALGINLTGTKWLGRVARISGDEPHLFVG